MDVYIAGGEVGSRIKNLLFSLQRCGLWGLLRASTFFILLTFYFVLGIAD